MLEYKRFFGTGALPEYGRRFLPLWQGVNFFFPLPLWKGVADLVTYTDLFVFCTLIVSLINLFVQIFQNKKK